MAGIEIHPEDRFTWERIVMRTRFEGVIGGSGRVSQKTGRQTRGGVSGSAFKAIALVFAAHANEDGTRIYPGDMTVAILAELQPRTVKVVREKLIELGMLSQTGRHGHTPMYRLTLPADLTELLIVLSPTQVVETAKAMRATARARKAKDRNGRTKGYSGGPPQSDGRGTPEDHPKDPDEPPADDAKGWSSGHPQSTKGWSSGQDRGGPPDTLNHVRTGQLKITTEKSGVDLGTAVTLAREPVKTKTPHPSPSKCDHGLSAATRADGRPACALCRREHRAAGPPEPDPPPTPPSRCRHGLPAAAKDRCSGCLAEQRGGNVIDLNSRRAS